MISSPPAAEDQVRGAVAGAGVFENDVEPLTRRVLNGLSLVVVRAGFGRAFDAIEILDSFGPVASNAASGEYNPGAAGWNDPAPLSSLLGLPTVFRSAEMKSSLAAPTLTAGDWELSKALGIPLLLANDRPSTGLSHDPAPFSSLLKLPTLV